jgi:DNA-directed RNA polymerase specialized sigma24 family protein
MTTSPELGRTLRELGDRDREVIALRFGGDLTGPEIASLIDLSLADIQQIISRSLRKLRGCSTRKVPSQSKLNERRRADEGQFRHACR